MIGGKEMVKVNIEQKFIITLSKDEAVFLYRIMNCIGGDPKKSSRKYADAINNALLPEVVNYITLTGIFDGFIKCKDDLEV